MTILLVYMLGLVVGSLYNNRALLTVHYGLIIQSKIIPVSWITVTGNTSCQKQVQAKLNL